MNSQIDQDLKIGIALGSSSARGWVVTPVNLSSLVAVMLCPEKPARVALLMHRHQRILPVRYQY